MPLRARGGARSIRLVGALPGVTWMSRYDGAAGVPGAKLPRLAASRPVFPRHDHATGITGSWSARPLKLQGARGHETEAGPSRSFVSGPAQRAARSVFNLQGRRNVAFDPVTQTRRAAFCHRHGNFSARLRVPTRRASVRDPLPDPQPLDVHEGTPWHGARSLAELLPGSLAHGAALGRPRARGARAPAQPAAPRPAGPPAVTRATTPTTRSAPTSRRCRAST
jgi:hypothetical protein